MPDPSQSVEALLFASADPVSETALKHFLQAQDFESERLEEFLGAIQKRYADHAIELVAVARGWQFRTRQVFAPLLTRVVKKPRRLSRSVMETLAVIAYHQPCTRADIETIRGVSLSQSVLDALIEEALITPKGRKDVPGRPILWATTETFLTKFGLRDLKSLPRREELLLEPASRGTSEDGNVPQENP